MSKSEFPLSPGMTLQFKNSVILALDASIPAREVSAESVIVILREAEGAVAESRSRTYLTLGGPATRIARAG
jgi:hypothetical protein